VYKRGGGFALYNYTSPDGAKNRNHYRYFWNLRPMNVPNDDYAPLYALVNAFNLPAGALYRTRTSALAEMSTWIGYLAINHIIGNKDSWGYFWHNNAYLYAPPDRPSELYLCDLDMSMERSSSENLFYNDGDSGPDAIATQIYADPGSAAFTGAT